jgi:hypothetical protein
VERNFLTGIQRYQTLLPRQRRCVVRLIERTHEPSAPPAWIAPGSQVWQRCGADRSPLRQRRPEDRPHLYTPVWMAYIAL